MLNMIKMDLYRMFRTKSMYVVWIVLAVSVLFTTFMCKTDYDSLSKEDTVRQEQFAEPTAENINVGMMVTLPTEPGEKVTVYDIFFANSQGKFYALFLVIFAVMFSTADIGSGYIKNIGGQVHGDGGGGLPCPGKKLSNDGGQMPGKTFHKSRPAAYLHKPQPEHIPAPHFQAKSYGFAASLQKGSHGGFSALGKQRPQNTCQQQSHKQNIHTHGYARTEAKKHTFCKLFSMGVQNRGILL